MKHRILLTISLLASLMLFQGCAGTKIVNGNPYGFCPIPVFASKAVTDDLSLYTYKPETIRYFQQIGTEQKDIERYCK